MTLRMKIVLGVTALALATTLTLLLLGAQQLRDVRYALKELPKPTASPTPTAAPASGLPAPGSDIDEVVNALLADSLNEQMVLQTEEQDTELLELDSQEIGNFIQVYDENEL